MQITAIGGATVDIIVVGADTATGPGAKQEVDHIGLYAGGGAVNAGLSFAACGASVHVAVAIGADLEGQLLRGALAQRGIDVKGVETIPDYPTGKAVVYMGSSGEASVFAQRGASTKLSFLCELPNIQNADVMYVSALSEHTTKSLLNALLALSDSAFKLVLNPGASQLSQTSDSLKALLMMADLVCVNAIEAQLLAQIPLDRQSHALTPAQAQTLAPKITQHAAQSVLITLGSQGAVFFDGQQSHHSPAAQTAVVSTLGAGDTFASTFTFHWASGQSPWYALAAATQRAVEVLHVASANLAGPLSLNTSTA